MRPLDPGKYHLGPLCKRGHDHENTGQSLRYIASCVKCQRLTAVKFKARMPHEVRRERDRRWYATARDEGRASYLNRVSQASEWKKANPEKRKEIQRRYVKNHRKRLAEIRRIARQAMTDLRRVKNRARGLTFGAIKRGEMPHANAVACADCGHRWSPGDYRHEYDHYLGYAGGNARRVQAVCKSCHTARGARRLDAAGV